MHEISREYWFSAAHQLTGHPKCGRLHGHNYKVVVTLNGDIHESGMIMDFGEVDKVVKPIVERLDHRYIASEDTLNDDFASWLIDEAPDDYICKLPISASTAECLAGWFFRELSIEGLSVADVEVWETPKSMAVYYEL